MSMWYLDFLGLTWSKKFNCLDFVVAVLYKQFEIDVDSSVPTDVEEGTQYQKGDVITLEKGNDIHVGIYVKDAYLLNLRKNVGSELTSLGDFYNLGFKTRNAYRYDL